MPAWGPKGSSHQVWRVHLIWLTDGTALRQGIGSFVVIEFYNFKKTLPCNLCTVQKELSSGKVSGLPKVKKEGVIGSEAIILRLYHFFYLYIKRKLLQYRFLNHNLRESDSDQGWGPEICMINKPVGWFGSWWSWDHTLRNMTLESRPYDSQTNFFPKE